MATKSNPNRLTRLALMASVMWLGACQATLNSSAVDARLSASDNEARAQIADKLSSHYSRAVVVAPNAFVESSVLALESGRVRGPTARVANGRILEGPRSVRLVSREGRCLLVDQVSGEIIALESVSCVPVTN